MNLQWLSLITHLPIGSSMDLHLIFSELFEKSINENFKEIFYIFSAISFIISKCNKKIFLTAHL